MLSRTLKTVQNLSLDVVLGAVTMSWLFAKANETNIPVSIYLILGIAVWLIYTLDHLLDAKKIEGRASTARHQFHQKHSAGLTLVWIAMLTISLCFALIYLPLKTWQCGSVVVVFTIIYFILIHFFGSIYSKFIVKEVGVASGYALGVVVGPLSYLEHFSALHLLSFFFLFIIAFFNLAMFSFFEFKSDVQQGHTSITVNFGRSRTVFILHSVFATSLILGLSLLVIGNGNPYFYFFNGYLLIISILYYLTILASVRMNRTGLYRVLGDGVFVAPLILLILG